MVATLVPVEAAQGLVGSRAGVSGSGAGVVEDYAVSGDRAGGSGSVAGAAAGCAVPARKVSKNAWQPKQKAQDVRVRFAPQVGH